MYNNDKNTIDSDLVGYIVKAILFFMLMTWLLVSSRSCDRENHNMVEIKPGLCYERDTNIVYIEESGRSLNFIYLPYYDTNGEMCKYDTITREIVNINEYKKNNKLN